MWRQLGHLDNPKYTYYYCYTVVSLSVCKVHKDKSYIFDVSYITFKRTSSSKIKQLKMLFMFCVVENIKAD